MLLLSCLKFGAKAGGAILAIMSLQLFSTACLAGEAQSRKIEATNDSGSATLVLFRRKFSPPIAFKPMIRISGEDLIHISAGSYVEVKLLPGNYALEADWSKKHGVQDASEEIVLADGSVTYIEVSTSGNVIFTGIGVGVAPTVGESSLARTDDVSKVHDQLKKYSKNFKRAGGWYNHPFVIQPAYISGDMNDLTTFFVNGEPVDKRYVAKMALNRGYDDARLLSAFNEEVQNHYAKKIKDKYLLDGIALMCRALAVNGGAEYKELLEEVAANAKEKKLRRYAKKYIEAYFSQLEVKKRSYDSVYALSR